MPKILIVEDDDVARELLCQTLARQGWDPCILGRGGYTEGEAFNLRDLQ